MNRRSLSIITATRPGLKMKFQAGTADEAA